MIDLSYPPPRPSWGQMLITMLGVLCAIVTIACVLVTMAGCTGLPKPSGCQPLSTRCSPDGLPQTCSTTMRWYGVGQPCPSVGATCCLVTGPSGDPLYGCAPNYGACLPEPPQTPATVQDGGVE